MRSIVHYVRKGHRKPIGCVVILDKDHIGFSLVHMKDQKEHKGIAKKALFHFAKVRADDRQVMPLTSGNLSDSPFGAEFQQAWCYMNGHELKMVPHEVRKILARRFREVAYEIRRTDEA